MNLLDFKQGEPWGEKEKAAWLSHQVVKRSYADDVLAPLDGLADRFEIGRYGALEVNAERYPLYLVQTRDRSEDRPTVLITGGVHGYETSGVHGALRILETLTQQWEDRCQFVCAPCVSPWGYETINRWNPHTIDPNRAFHKDSPAQECRDLMAAIEKLETRFLLHLDLHETTDTDNTQFRPERAARDGIAQSVWNIPDGFYLVGDTSKPQPEFEREVIRAVSQVTHIAQADESGCLIGKKVTQPGVIDYDVQKLHLCAGMTSAPYVGTTEVYPDSPRTNSEECIRSQVAAVEGALQYCLTRSENSS